MGHGDQANRASAYPERVAFRAFPRRFPERRTCTHKKGPRPLAEALLSLEPAMGLEPMTCGLRISCSATELRRPIHLVRCNKQNGAGDGARTRGLRLGKPTFYH